MARRRMRPMGRAACAWLAFARAAPALVCAAAMTITPALADTPPTAREILGHAIGDDHYLASYGDAISYLRALAAASKRIRLVDAGTTARGCTMSYAIISSPDNLAKWDRIKAASRALADPRTTTPERARDIARDTPIVVHIDGGPHSNEAAAQQLPLALAEALVRADDAATARLLDRVVVVLWPTLNPDGQDEIVDWYRRNLGTAYEVAPLPDLYQDYSGHDNNRDAFMLNLRETQVVNRALLDYAPAVFYSHHQRARYPTRIWVPPFVDPVSAAVSPTTRKWTDVFGTRMMMRFVDDALPGATTQGKLDNWYPGSYDSMASWRHAIGLISETALYEYATPRCYDRADFSAEFADLAPRATYPLPWRGGCWHIADAIRYMMVASRAVLDTADIKRERLLLDRYRSALYAVATPQRIGIWAYVIPPEQRDGAEARQLVSTLEQLGIEVSRTTDTIRSGDSIIDPGSWIVRLDQPFGNLAADLLGVQRYPGALLEPNGETKGPILDSTAWSLPLKMGVSVRPIATPLPNVTVQALRDDSGEATSIFPATVRSASVRVRATNAGFRFVNLALAAHARVTRDARTFIVGNLKPDALASLAARSGVELLPGPSQAGGEFLHRARIGLYRPWLPSMDEGWTRLVLERHHFGFRSLRPADMAGAQVWRKLDVVIIPDMSGDELRDGFARGSIAPRYVGGLAGAGLVNLRRFVERGGTVIAHNEAALALVHAFDLPVTDVRDRPEAKDLAASDALLRVEVTGAPANADPVAITYADGPIFVPGAAFAGRRICSYPASGSPLLSGAGRRFGLFAGHAACLDAKLGAGHVILFGFRPADRAQSHVTYPLEFDHLYAHAPAR